MARPTKTGLDYYPMDVGFLREKKVRLLRTEFGASSVLFVLYVFGKVYEGDGYFLEWDKDEMLIAADELRESPTYISEVLQGCLSRSLFDQRVFQMFGILTSAGIQRRYLRSCEKRDVITIVNEYWLLDVNDKKDVLPGTRAKLTFLWVSGEKNGVNSPETQVDSPENPQSKVKESKGNILTTTNSACARERDEGLGRVMSAFMDKINPTPSQNCLDLLNGYCEEMGAEVCLEAIDRAMDAGSTKRNWNYIRGILRNLSQQGVKCLADWKRLEEDRDEKSRASRPASGRKVPYGSAGQGPLGELEQDALERMLRDAEKGRAAGKRGTMQIMTTVTILDQRREILRLQESLKAAEERLFELAYQLERVKAERNAAVQMAERWTREYSAGSAACIFMGGFAAAWAGIYCLVYPDPFKAILMAATAAAATWVGWRLHGS